MDKHMNSQISSYQVQDETRVYKLLTEDFEYCNRSLVGAKGFEPSTSCTPCKHASRTAPRPELTDAHYKGGQPFPQAIF